jgi:hypothetical protein
MAGWIKLQRKMIDWEWFTDVNTCHLFTYLLLAATHANTKWRGIALAPGQLITGRTQLAEKTGLSEQQIRTALDKLKATSEITSESTNNFTVITITNWKIYQHDNQPTNQPITSQLTNEQPTDNQRITTFNNANNINNEKKIIKDIGGFEIFWNSYNYKVGKQNAKKAYDKAIKNGADPNIILEGVKRYQKDCQAKGLEVKFFKHPTTWLNGAHWEDEFITGTAKLSDADEMERLKNLLGGKNESIPIHNELKQIV